jgi:hypothetical protein
MQLGKRLLAILLVRVCGVVGIQELMGNLEILAATIAPVSLIAGRWASARGASGLVKTSARTWRTGDD